MKKLLRMTICALIRLYRHFYLSERSHEYDYEFEYEYDDSVPWHSER